MTEDRDGETAPEEAAAADRPASAEKTTRANERESSPSSESSSVPEEHPAPDGPEDPEGVGRHETSDEASGAPSGTDAPSDAENTASTDAPSCAAKHSSDAAASDAAEDALSEDSAPSEAPEADAASEGRTKPVRAKSGARTRRSRSRLTTVVSVGGELLITAGVVLGLFVAYSLWWTNVVADREASKESNKVRENWASGRDLGDDDSKGPGQLDTKDGVGFLHAPALGKKEILIKPGTNPKDLNQGIAGYYEKPVKSAMPWDKEGNFSLAAHRDGHGAKFHNIHKLKDGDPLVFETKDTWYVYKVYSTLPETSKYNVDVLDPVPKESGKKEAGRYITLTTCTPVYTSNYRYIVWGELERTEVVDADRTPPTELVDH